MSVPYGLRISLQKNIYFQCFAANAKRSSPQKCRFFDWPAECVSGWRIVILLQVDDHHRQQKHACTQIVDH